MDGGEARSTRHVRTTARARRRRCDAHTGATGALGCYTRCMDEPTPSGMTEELFHSCLTFGVKRNASDIHFEVGYPPTYRILGELVAARHAPLSHADTEAIAGLLLADA